MKLYLVQHAKAASKDVDPQRPLTDEGRRDIEKVAAFLKPLKLTVDVLWHSGKTRAAQTAETLAQVVRVKEGMIARDGLTPNDDVTMLKDDLDVGDNDVMIVGHLPFLSKLASLLLAGDESAGTVAFQQGGVICLEQPAEGRWQIDWMIIPELLT
jgi:phosphohistidine phosphatase